MGAELANLLTFAGQLFVPVVLAIVALLFLRAMRSPQ